MFYILRNGQLIDIDDPAQRTTYAPNPGPACCDRCGLTWLADGRWVRVEGKLVCESCRKEGEAR